MAHPLFARLDRQLELVRGELANALEADRLFHALRRRAARRKADRDLYHEWSHNAALADGVSAIYTGLESVLEAIGNEIDEYTPRGDASHAEKARARIRARLPPIRRTHARGQINLTKIRLGLKRPCRGGRPDPRRGNGSRSVAGAKAATQGARRACRSAPQ